MHTSLTLTRALLSAIYKYNFHSTNTETSTCVDLTVFQQLHPRQKRFHFFSPRRNISFFTHHTYRCEKKHTRTHSILLFHLALCICGPVSWNSDDITLLHFCHCARIQRAHLHFRRMILQLKEISPWRGCGQFRRRPNAKIPRFILCIFAVSVTVRIFAFSISDLSVCRVSEIRLLVRWFFETNVSMRVENVYLKKKYQNGYFSSILRNGNVAYMLQWRSGCEIVSHRVG